MKVIIIFTFCCDNLWKSKFMALEMPGKLGEFYFSYFVATLLQLVLIMIFFCCSFQLLFKSAVFLGYHG